MKTKHQIISIEEIERKQMDKDPLAKLNKSLTRRLDNFFSMSAEDDDSVFEATRNPEYKAVKRFLAHV